MRIFPVAVAVSVFSACSPAPAGSPPASGPEERIIAELVASTEAWNEGDLDGFLEPYSDSATYVGSSGMVRGKEALRETYTRNYWSTGAPEEDLRFEDIGVRPLGPDHALLTGRYLLFDAAGVQQADGPFTLIYARTGDGWRIVHDHSS